MKGKLVIALYKMWTKGESESRYKRESSEWQATYYDNYNCLIWIFHIYVHGLKYSVNPLLLTKFQMVCYFVLITITGVYVDRKLNVCISIMILIFLMCLS